MPLTAEIDQITKTRGVMASATLAFSTFAEKVQAGIDAALAKGATEAQLAPLRAAVVELEAETAPLAAAVAANP